MQLTNINDRLELELRPCSATALKMLYKNTNVISSVKKTILAVKERNVVSKRPKVDILETLLFHFSTNTPMMNEKH